MNDGVAYIYDVEGNGKSEGGRPLKTLESKGYANFEYLSVSAEDYRFAMQEDVKLDVRIRILQNRKLSSQNVMKINDIYYEVWRIKHVTTKAGIPVTDVILKASVVKFKEVSI